MKILKLYIMLIMLSTMLFVAINTFATESSKTLARIQSSKTGTIAIETEKTDGTKIKGVLMQKGNKARLEETFPNSDEIGSIIISDGTECWHITAAGKPQKYPLIKNPLELIGIDEETAKKEEKIDNRVRKIAGAKETIQYKEFTETENFGMLPRIIEIYDSAQVLQSRSLIKDVENDREPSNDLFNYRKVTFSAKAKEIAKKMHFE